MPLSPEPGQALSDHPGRLSEAVLCGTRWEYGAADGSPPWGVLQLVPFALPWPVGHPRGRVVGFEHPNEQLWELVDGVLLFLNGAGRPTTIFTHLLEENGGIVLRGRHRLPGGGLHQLRAVSGSGPIEAAPPEGRLAIQRQFGRNADVLLVRFNSLANPAPVLGPFRREYSRVADSLGADSLHLAEGDGVPSWFLRHRAEIEDVLRQACAGRRLVVLVGNSSGGYAALRFGEWLRAEQLAPSVRTVSVNPQTVHGAAHRQYLLSRDWTALLPLMIDQAVLGELAPTGADLPVLFDANRRRRELLPARRHLVFFDSENPVECYYAARLGGRRSVVLQPMPVGRAHGWGIHEIERSGVVREALTRAVQAPRWRDRLGRGWWLP